MSLPAHDRRNFLMFVSLDGVDGGGKSTQIALLVEWLRDRGLDVVACRDPGSTPLGNEIRRLLLDSHETPLARRAEALLYMAARAQLVDEVIRPALAADKTVVCDRFLLANVVYQGHAGDLPVEWLWRIGEFATGGLAPDLSIVFDLPVDMALARLNRPLDRLESRGAVYLERVRQGFLSEAARSNGRVQVIAADQPTASVQANVRRTIATRFFGETLPGGA